MVHLAALEAAATAQTGGGRHWRGRGEGGQAGGRRWGEREREAGAERGSRQTAEEAKRMRGHRLSRRLGGDRSQGLEGQHQRGSSQARTYP